MGKEYCTVTFRGDTQGHSRPWQMSFNFHLISYSSSATADTPKDLCEWLRDNVCDALNNDFIQILPNACTVKVIDFKSIVAPGFWPYSLGLSGVSGVRGSGEILPEGTGPLVLLRSTDPIEGDRGYTRSYLPAILETDQQSGAINQDLVNEIEEFISIIKDIDDTAGTGFQAQLVVYSHKLSTHYNVEQWAVADQIARIKRRARGFQGRFAGS